MMISSSASSSSRETSPDLILLEGFLRSSSQYSSSSRSTYSAEASSSFKSECRSSPMVVVRQKNSKTESLRRPVPSVESHNYVEIIDLGSGPEDDDETVRRYQSVHSSNSDESWTGSNIEILSDDDTVAEELSPRKARNSDLDTRKRRHSASPPLPAKIPCLRESHREELWPNDVRLNDFELRLLYNCIRRSQFPVRVRHELAPYAFKLDGGRPYAVNAHARHPLDDETSALIFRVLGQPDWVGKVENARKLMKNRGNTREHSAFCARNVTESFRELFRRAGMNGDQRHQHFSGAIPSDTEQRQAAGENVADNYRPKTGRRIRDDSVEFVEERVRDFHPPQETSGQFQESFRNILIETLQEVLSARTAPSGSDARSIVRGNAQKPAGDGVAESSTAGRRPGKHVDLHILQALPKASSTTHGSTQGSASRYSAAEAGPSTREARRQGNPHICPSSKHDGDLPEPFCGLHIKAIPRCTALMGNIVVWAMHVKSIADCRDEKYHSKELISACVARAYPEFESLSAVGHQLGIHKRPGFSHRGR